MVMAVGLAAPAPAMYHLAAHAFFKALLFLGAGSVIHALHHEQNIWNMGGLSRKMPVTFWTFLCGTLALCGVPPFSGFFSKDEILAQAAHHSVGLFLVSSVVAFLTAFYMFRLVLVAFAGPARSPSAGAVRESARVMTWPLVALAGRRRCWPASGASSPSLPNNLTRPRRSKPGLGSTKSLRRLAKRPWRR